jgi:peptidoglycan/xylan/chitin deacetylase (PgdA/CDA1 family)
LHYFRKTPKLLERSFPDVLWRIKGADESIYLTFDDGPDPGSTPILLDLLDQYDARATFFCLGRQVEKHPELLQDIIDRGHGVGNHGYAHLSGWKTPMRIYLEEVERASILIPSRLFRPPYGRISWRQYRALRKDHRIVMWTRMPGDFDPEKGKEDMVREARKPAGNGGEIIVLHDSPECLENTMGYLTRLFELKHELSYGVIPDRSL